MRHYIKYFLFVLGLLLFTVGCQKVDVMEFQEESTQKEKFEITYVDWIHFKEENKPIADKITAINNDINATDRTDSSIYGFSIDETEAQIIEQIGFTTYTFPVIKDDLEMNVVENYVYKEFEDGTYSQFLLTYNYTLDENDNLVLDTNHLDILPIDDDSLILGREPCFPEFTQVGTEWVCIIRFRCTGLLPDPGHEMGDTGCSCGDPGYNCLPAGLSCDFEPVFGWTSCTSGGTDTDTDDNNNNTNTTGGNHTGDDTTSTGEDFVFSTPTRSKVERLVENCLNDGSAFTGDGEAQMLDPSYIDLSSYNLTDAQRFEIYQYLISANGCSDEAKENVVEDFETFNEADIENFSVNLLTHECTKLLVRDDIIGTGNPVNAGLINIIRNTFNSDDNVTLAFRNTGNMPVGVSASTDFDTDTNINSGIYSIIISFNDSYLNNNPTKLSIALTAIHEMVHAKLMYAHLNGTLLTEYPNFTDLSNKFTVFLNDRTEANGLALEKSTHESMVSLISTMSYALFKYAKHKGMDNVTEQYCKEITKGSFYETPSAMELINTGESTPEQLRDKFINEQDNTTDAKGDDC
jgi:hypothetical protein